METEHWRLCGLRQALTKHMGAGLLIHCRNVLNCADGVRALFTAIRQVHVAKLELQRVASRDAADALGKLLVSFAVQEEVGGGGIRSSVSTAVERMVLRGAELFEREASRPLKAARLPSAFDNEASAPVHHTSPMTLEERLIREGFGHA